MESRIQTLLLKLQRTAFLQCFDYVLDLDLRKCVMNFSVSWDSTSREHPLLWHVLPTHTFTTAVVLTKLKSTTHFFPYVTVEIRACPQSSLPLSKEGEPWPWIKNSSCSVLWVQHLSYNRCLPGHRVQWMHICGAYGSKPKGLSPWGLPCSFLFPAGTQSGFSSHC